MLKGSLVAIVTPMQPDGALDLAGASQADRLARRERHLRHRRRRHDGRVADGRRRRALPADQDRGRARGRAHPGDRRHRRATPPRKRSSSPPTRRRWARRARLSVVPYYNKPSQEGLYRHFRTIAEKVDLPLHPLQRSRPHRRRSRQRYGAAPGAGAGDRRASRMPPSDLGRGSELLRGARRGGQVRFRRLQRRRHHRAAADADRRPRRDLGDRQRRAEADGARCAQRALVGRYRRARAKRTIACCPCTGSCSSRRIRFR